MFKRLKNLRLETNKECVICILIHIILGLFIFLPIAFLYVDLLKYVSDNYIIINQFWYFILGSIIPIIITFYPTFSIGLYIYEKLSKGGKDIPTINK